MRWLGVDLASESKVFILLPSYAIESWILACTDPSHEVFSDLDKPINYEAISDFEARLIKIGLSSRKQGEVRKLNKKYKNYVSYADMVFECFDDVCKRCEEAENYRDFIRTD